ncbi:hypothetical protein MPH_07059 [Macrophomina phaseolina MS6]|uniref:Uncharacterized protein n=1 Tax=Macrophomina phaseolina (strain MS6) TaxID=1126212 RepID=K2RZK4_MACPH|nr:hypothetical protein MPH_07059 [Macrophomina phaseolina MS6]
MEAFSGGSQPTEPLTNHPRTEMFNGYASPGPSLSTVDSPSAASGGMRFLYEELETVSLRLLCSGRTVVSADIEQSSYWHGAAIREPAHTGLKLPYRDVFAGPRAPTIPPQSFTDLEVQQLIELWFAHHPLAFILSKSLLLHSYRNGTQDFELLALVLADASDFLGREDINTSQAMFEAARARVLERPAISLSAMQALVLLGWHDFCLYQPRQGYIYLELARMIAAQRLNVSSQASPTAHHINGADIGDVEIDLTQRIYWFTTSFILWLSLHQSSPDLDILSALDVAPLPPNDPSFSAVYALDEGVGNIASLVAQKTAIRELWSLAHLTSTILPLFKLHLGGTTQSSPHKQSTPYWSPPLAPQALDHPIPSGQTARALLCAAFTRLPVQLDHSNPAQTFTHSALHLLAITSAFPSPQQQKQTDDRIVRAVPVAEVLRSIQAFLAATKTLARQAALQDLLDHDIRTAPLWLESQQRAKLFLSRQDDPHALSLESMKKKSNPTYRGKKSLGLVIYNEMKIIRKSTSRKGTIDRRSKSPMLLRPNASVNTHEAEKCFVPK